MRREHVVWADFLDEEREVKRVSEVEVLTFLTFVFNYLIQSVLRIQTNEVR